MFLNRHANDRLDELMPHQRLILIHFALEGDGDKVFEEWEGAGKVWREPAMLVEAQLVLLTEWPTKYLGRAFVLFVVHQHEDALHILQS